jgi:hypothetical protein
LECFRVQRSAFTHCSALGLREFFQLASFLYGELRGEFKLYFEMANEEAAFVEAFSPHPTRDFVVALAGVARATSRRDVVEGVATATGQCQYAISLQRRDDCSAIRATTPGLLQCKPLLVAEVMLNAVHPTLTSSGGNSFAASVHGHDRGMLTAGRGICGWA